MEAGEECLAIGAVGVWECEGDVELGECQCAEVSGWGGLCCDADGESLCLPVDPPLISGDVLQFEPAFRAGETAAQGGGEFFRRSGHL